MVELLKGSSLKVAVNTAALVLLLLSAAAHGQFIVAPHAGVISLTEGQVVLLNPSDEHGIPDPSNDVIEERWSTWRRELHVGTIHHVERSGLGHDGVEDVDVVKFSVGNLNQCGDRATQIEQDVPLDGGLVGSKPGPLADR